VAVLYFPPRTHFLPNITIVADHHLIVVSGTNSTMSSHKPEDERYDPFEDLDFVPTIKNMPRAKSGGKGKAHAAPARKPASEVI
jgi:hypothetical protein